ncbi:MAG: ACT domain-containing protein [Actinomycetota bacterium]
MAMTDPERSRHTVRVWLPDRPGGLGAIASRVGAVGAEIVGIEIIERDGGQAIDDLLIELPADVGTELLVKELSEVDGARIEDIRDMTDAPVDARLQALQAARSLAESPAEEVHGRLCDHARTDTGADWAACVDLDRSRVLAGSGASPPTDWLVAYARGAQAVDEGGAGRERSTSGETGAGTEHDDTACLPITGLSVVLTVGRHRRAFRPRERAALGLLADLAAARIASCNGDANRTH